MAVNMVLEYVYMYSGKRFVANGVNVCSLETFIAIDIYIDV